MDSHPPTSEKPETYSWDNVLIQYEQLCRQNEVIIARSLNAGAVLFNFKASVLSKTTAYDAILSIGPVNGARVISQSPSLLIETVFTNLADAEEAMFRGGSYLGTVFRATPTFAPEAEIVQVDLTSLPFFSREKLCEDIKDTMKAYGRVCQICLYVQPETHVFEGDVTVILDITPKPTNNEKHEQYLPIARTIYFDAWDQKIQVSFKSTPPYCRYCCKEGHRKSECRRT